MAGLVVIMAFPAGNSNSRGGGDKGRKNESFQLHFGDVAVVGGCEKTKVVKRNSE